jgi:hypothetical protein
MTGGPLDLAAMEALTAPQWKRGSQYHVESECGCWSISKSFHGPRATYTLWHRDNARCRYERCGDYPSFDLAKEAAR